MTKIKFYFRYLITILLFLVSEKVKANFAETNQSVLPNNFEDTSSLLEKSNNIITILLFFILLASFIGLIISGIRFIYAGGNEEILNKAKTTALSSFIGIIVSLLGYIILKLITFLFLN